MIGRPVLSTALLLTALGAHSIAALENVPAYYGKWKNGLPSDTAFFPIGVWLQEPSDAPAYKAAGVNLYIGLWSGPTTGQLQTLKSAGMKTICDQNLSMLADYAGTIVGWMHNDEPDNAQSNGSGGYDPCIDTSIIKQEYAQWRAADTTRPIYLNLGRGVADTNWIGRGACTGNTRLYPGYIRGCDIVSYDIYPFTGSDAPALNNPWYVALGTDNLNRWSGNAKPAWCFIECTQVGSTGTKPTPAQVKSMVWMAIIHNAKGIEYFCHQFSPTTNTNALLDDAPMLAGVTALNQRIISLAPALNDSTRNSLVGVSSSNAGVPIDRLVKVHGGYLYIFAVAMRSGTATGTFIISGLAGMKTAEVIDESRTVAVTAGVMSDAFGAFGAHLYKIPFSASANAWAPANTSTQWLRQSGTRCIFDCRGIRMPSSREIRGLAIVRVGGAVRKCVLSK